MQSDTSTYIRVIVAVTDLIETLKILPISAGSIPMPLSSIIISNNAVKGREHSYLYRYGDKY